MKNDWSHQVHDSGGSPEEVYIQAKFRALDKLTCYRLLRNLFGLSLLEAKQVMLTVDDGISLEEHQRRLTPPIVRLLETDDTDDG